MNPCRMTAADEPDHDDAPQAAGTQRIDKWLWFARIIKSRTLAAELVVEGKVRVNRVRATKPSQTVRAGDVLTVTLRGRVDILRVLAPGERRGPPDEARRLYEVLTPEGHRQQGRSAIVVGHLRTRRAPIFVFRRRVDRAPSSSRRCSQAKRASGTRPGQVTAPACSYIAIAAAAKHAAHRSGNGPASLASTLTGARGAG